MLETHKSPECRYIKTWFSKVGVEILYRSLNSQPHWTPWRLQLFCASVDEWGQIPALGPKYSGKSPQKTGSCDNRGIQLNIVIVSKWDVILRCPNTFGYIIYAYFSPLLTFKLKCWSPHFLGYLNMTLLNFLETLTC